MRRVIITNTWDSLVGDKSTQGKLYDIDMMRTLAEGSVLSLVRHANDMGYELQNAAELLEMVLVRHETAASQ